MYKLSNNFKKNIKRRNFFVYLGVSVISIFTVSKLPFKLFSSKVKREIYGNKKIKIIENPYAVKRETLNRING